MLKTELIERSPIRILDQTVKGGLLEGHLGMFASRKGVGKTACLVHVATDQMLQDRNVIHLSFSDTTDHIEQWYEDIFREISHKYQLDHAQQIHDQTADKRVLMKFDPTKSSLASIEKSVSTLMEQAHIHARLLVIDGFDLGACPYDDLYRLQQFAVEKHLAIWFSTSLVAVRSNFNMQDLTTIVQENAGLFSIVVLLESQNGHVRLRLLKDYDEAEVPDMHLELDPKSLLIKEE